MKFSNLKGAKTLSAKAQKSINGGKFHCSDNFDCPTGWTCVERQTTGDHAGYCQRTMPNNI